MMVLPISLKTVWRWRVDQSGAG